MGSKYETNIEQVDEVEYELFIDGIEMLPSKKHQKSKHCDFSKTQENMIRAYVFTKHSKDTQICVHRSDQKSPSEDLLKLK